jgi:hypothetical protein
MEYQIEEDVKEFIGKLPTLVPNPPTAHLIMLAVRSRKAREIMKIKVKDLVVEREIIRPIQDWRDRYFNSVSNLATLQHLGRYNVKTNLVPPQAMGIFGTLSPRNVLTANAELMKDNITFLYQRDESSLMEIAKVPSRFFGMLHRHKDRSTNFVTLDLDNNDESLMKEILNKASVVPVWMVTETSRGYHIILDISKPVDARIFYGEEALIQKLGLEYTKKGLEIQKDSQEPIPGTFYPSKDKPKHFVRILQ